MLRDSRGPFRAQNTIRDFLHVRKEEIHRPRFGFAAAQVHLARARDQIIDKRRRFLQPLLIFLRALFADVQVGIGFLVAYRRKREDAHFEILLEQKRQRALRGRLPGGVGIVIHDDALRETAEQLDLLLGEAGSAARHHVADARTRHGNRVHVAFDQNHEVLAPDTLFRAVQVIKHVALGIDGRLGRVQIFRLVIAKRAAAEGNHLSRFVGNWKRDAPAKAVKELAALIAGDEAGFDEQLFVVF